MKLTKELSVSKLVKTDADGNLSIPYEVSIRLVHSKSLKAVAKIEYAGVIINDIYIIDRFGRISIQFPLKTFEDKEGKMRKVTVASPSVPQISREFNQAIMEAYKEACSAEAIVTDVAA